MIEDGSWIFFLEAGVALSVLLLIVWGTWPKGKSGDQASKPEKKDE